MKKHTFPGEQEEMPATPRIPEIKPPADPREPQIPEKEIEKMPPEIPPGENQPVENPPQRKEE